MSEIYLLFLCTSCGQKLVGVHSSEEQAEIARKDMEREAPRLSHFEIAHCTLDDYGIDGFYQFD